MPVTRREVIIELENVEIAQHAQYSSALPSFHRETNVRVTILGFAANYTPVSPWRIPRHAGVECLHP